MQRSRYTVGLAPGLADQVRQFVRLGLESQENRKREFFRRLNENLATTIRTSRIDWSMNS
jgi:hypothetical protein